MSAGSIDVAAVMAAAANFKDPESGRPVTEMEQVRDVQVEGASVSVTLDLTTHSAPLKNEVRDAFTQLLREKLPSAESIQVELGVQDRPPQKLGTVGLTAKTVIAVGSGKGGVGKSTVATSLAYALQRAGSAVGLMDADVYGPSVPMLTGTTEGKAEMEGEKSVKPVDADGVKVMSIGYMVPPDQAVIWRGPMLHGVVTQFLRDINWGHLDYLVIDMPPGTGDVALSLSQVLSPAGAVIVCTPQDVALLDAVKAINMFNKVNIPILGVVENMSGFVCPDCEKRHDIFGSGGARKRAEELQVPFLGEVPINIKIRENGDAGQTSHNFDDPVTAACFERIAYQLVKQLADKAATAPPMPQLPVL